MQLFARFEADRFTWGDRHLGAGARIPPNPRLARTYVEDPESAQFDSVASGESFLETVEDGIDRSFRLVARQAGPLDHVVDDVLLDQRAHLGKSADSSLHPTPMLESFGAIVNALSLP